MMHGPNYARRKARGGRGLLPPNPKQWKNEHNGLDLRAELGLDTDVALPHEAAFDLLPYVTVLPHGEVPAAAKYLQQFRRRSSSWSGMAISMGGEELVLYNDSHPINRIRSTLMEEFFHLHLQHPRSVIRMYTEDGASRTYNKLVEKEAFGSGAAALVPYASLRTLVDAGDSVTQIAEQFQVSTKLVDFRMKVTKLWGLRRGRR